MTKIGRIINNLLRSKQKDQKSRIQTRKIPKDEESKQERFRKKINIRSADRWSILNEFVTGNQNKV